MRAPTTCWQFLDRIAKDIGSSLGCDQGPIAESQYNSGWFDTRADDIFMYSKGQLYAYYGISAGGPGRLSPRWSRSEP
nr:hypothetical protein [uncultured Brevundimonas sp.]